MKRIFSTLFCTSLLFCTWSQTLINSSDLMPTIGQVVYTESSQAIPQNTYLANGQGVQWDLSWFSASAQDSFKYLLPSDAAAPQLAPNADFIKQSSNSDLFVALNDSAYVSLYYHSYPYDTYEYDYNLVYNLPLEYGNIDTTYYSGEIDIAGQTTYRNVEHIQEVVGEGSVSTPNAFFDNCLKVKTIRFFSDSNAVTQSVIYTADTTYSWLKEGFSEVIFSINIRYSEAVQQNYYYNYMPLYDWANIDDNIWKNLSVSPNPSNGRIEIENISESCELFITNSIGKTIEKVTLTQAKNSINLEHLPPGVYFLKLDKQKNGKAYKLILN